MEYKVMPLEVKALSEEGKYEGYFSVTENQDDGGDTIHHGAFKKTISERAGRIHPFYLHDWEKLVGPPPAKILEDTHGLFVAGKLTTGAFWGRETWALLSDGALTEGSIGYETIKAERRSDAEGLILRDIWEIKLFEYSFVPLGMNALTQVRAVKAAMISMYKAAVPGASIETQTETLLLIAADLKEGRVLSTANKEKVRNAVDALIAASEALQALLAAAEPAPEKGDHYALTAMSRVRAAELALALASQT
jgi:hypothetical protein